MLLLNARLEPVESPAVAQGFLQIQQGKITAMGKMGILCPKTKKYTICPGIRCIPALWTLTAISVCGKTA